jgi:Zn finger protein HypA/HybF involved in hydrogenase expression
MKRRFRPIKVNCKKCGLMDENDVEFIDIAEGVLGEDILTFVCPKCKKIRLLCSL